MCSHLAQPGGTVSRRPQCSQKFVRCALLSCSDLHTHALSTAILQDMTVVEGVRIEDMGHKMGCNGVDNGKLWFDRAPLLACLHCKLLAST